MISFGSSESELKQQLSRIFSQMSDPDSELEEEELKGKNMFVKNDIIHEKFKVLFPIHNTTYGSSYRVQGLEDGNLYMLKIYEKERLQPWHYNKDGGLIELKFTKTLITKIFQNLFLVNLLPFKIKSYLYML